VSDIHILRPHTLGLRGARQAADDVAARLRADIGVDTTWEGDVLHVSGHGVTGRLVAAPDSVEVHARLGLVARPFRKRLLREIETELDRALLSPTS